LGIIKEQTIKGTIINYIGIGIGFVTTAILTPLVDSEIIGLISVIVSYSIIISNIGGLGLNGITVKLFPYQWMYNSSFPRTKVISCHPDIRISGILNVNTRKYQLINVPGQQSHLWGTQYAYSWVWTHCNSFCEEKAVFEGLSAKIKVGPFCIPRLTIFRQQGAEETEITGRLLLPLPVCRGWRI